MDFRIFSVYTYLNNSVGTQFQHFINLNIRKELQLCGLSLNTQKCVSVSKLQCTLLTANIH